MKASHVIGLARVLLKDVAGVRWPDDELLDWLNNGQLQIVVVRPDANAKKVDLTLVAGVEQSIPAGGLKLLDVSRNVGGRAITLISRDQLNAFDPDWYEALQQAVVKHYLFDAADPKSFEVYPPVEAGVKVRVLYSASPARVTDPNDDLELDDAYEGPLVDWVCYRAWIKNTDSPTDAGRAANSLATFMQALTGKTQTDQATRPARK